MSKESIVIRLQLTPSLENVDVLDGQSRICNWLYNHLVEEDAKLKEQFLKNQDPTAAKNLYTKRGLRNLLPKIKEDHPFLKVVHSSPLKNTALRLSDWKETLSWVKRKSGKLFFEFEEKGTTRTCSQCLYIQEEGIPLAIRQWQCPDCQTKHLRDENAAINGLRKVLRDLPTKSGGEIPSQVSSPDLDPVKERWAWSVLPSGVFVMLRGQDRENSHNSRKLNRERGSSRSKHDHLITYSQV